MPDTETTFEAILDRLEQASKALEAMEREHKQREEKLFQAQMHAIKTKYES